MATRSLKDLRCVFVIIIAYVFDESDLDYRIVHRLAGHRSTRRTPHVFRPSNWTMPRQRATARRISSPFSPIASRLLSIRAQRARSNIADVGAVSVGTSSRHLLGRRYNNLVPFSVNPTLKANKGEEAGFFKGHNSSNRRHIASNIDHYKVYTAACAEDDIKESASAVPSAILDARNAAAELASISAGVATSTVSSQSRLSFATVKGPTSFSTESLLDALTIHVVCDDQVGTFHRSAGV